MARAKTVPVIFNLRITEDMRERLQATAARVGLRPADVARHVLATGLAGYDAIGSDRRELGEARQESVSYGNSGEG